MNNLEKIVKGMEEFRADLKPFCGGTFDWMKFEAGLALLKEQGAKQPVHAHEEFPELEKVIKGIKCHRKKLQTTNAISCLECPYSEPKPIREWCMSGLMDDIYALLKEQNSCENCAIAIEDRQPVVRCKYCKHSIEWYRDKRRCFLWDENGIDVFDDGFCNYGKRRTDDA